MSGAPFRRFRDASPLPQEYRGGVVAIGNFDGVHRGHQAVMTEARAVAARLDRPLVCLTFEPHPRTVFQPDRPVPRLTPAPLKARLLEALGFSAVVEQPFDRAFASHSAENFVTETLLGQVGAAHVVVGFDFQFGAKRQGNATYLAAEGAKRGFGVTVVVAFSDEGGETVSSSRIRDALGEGDASGAASLLGYRWTVAGEIVHGQKLGRDLGYPTANMVLENDLLAHGIYAVRLRRADGSLHDGVASHGRRPTFDHGAPLFETHLFGFSGDLYGETVAVSIFAFLRGEQRFDGAAALVGQMDRDAAEARALLSSVRPLSELDRTIAF